MDYEDRIKQTREAFLWSTAESRRLRGWSQATRRWAEEQSAVWKLWRDRFVISVGLRPHDPTKIRGGAATIAASTLEVEEDGTVRRRGNLGTPPNLANFESLDEIAEMLRSLRESLNSGRESDRTATKAIVQQFEAHYKRRRAELS